jgi:hypothetical protein
LLQKCSRLAYLDQVGARPKVKEAMQSEGLLKAA